jgi:two-component system sensor histidine kinase QseC
MSLQRRLIVYLSLCAPLVWAVALWFSADQARHEVNELFDTELIRLARQVQATLGSRTGGAWDAPAAPVGVAAGGDADLADLAVAVWNREGEVMLVDREGARFPYRPQASGFTDVTLEGVPWRVYYLQSFAGEWLVAAGQKRHERDEVVVQLSTSQFVPWLLVLPVLLLAMAFAVRKALMPLRGLSQELAARSPDDLQPLPETGAPGELVPLLRAMNGLFDRIQAALVHERRFTADAAHELRTPLAVLRAQWDVVRRAQDGAARAGAEARMSAGFERLERLVSQLLSLSKLEGAGAGLLARQRVVWPAVVADAFGDCLPLAERRHIELACRWPDDGVAALPLEGDAQLVTVMLRNLVDNAVRYAPEHSEVHLCFGADRLAVENAGPPLDPALRARLGERFHRPDGQAESGSGLGISIVQRIAALHGLEVAFGSRADGSGVRAVVRRRASDATPVQRAP